MGDMRASYGDLDALLHAAPAALDSFHPSHGAFMTDLERNAQKVVASQDSEKAAEFLANVAYLTDC